MKKLLKTRIEIQQEKNKEIDRKIVARFSRGNARLQQGKYLTQEDVDARLARIRERAAHYGD